MSAPKRRKTSELWNFFTPLNNELATCNMCKCQLSYKSTTSNLRKHVESKHPIVTLPRNANIPQTTSKSAETPIEPVAVQEEPQPGCSSASPSPYSKEHITLANIIPRQETMVSYLPKKVTAHGKKNIDKKLIKLFTIDFQPFTIVEDEGFKEFVHSLNPQYQLPSRHTISKTMIPAIYEEVLHNTRNLVSNGKKFCITTDNWTSINTTSYIAVTAHYVNDEFKLISVLLESSAMTAEHTSQNLAIEISRILQEWEIDDKIILAVSDNASNIQGALKTIMNLKHFGCFAHTLNLLVNDALNVEAVTNLLNKIKVIVSHFRRSYVSNRKLIECQQNQGDVPLKLVQDVSTRWNSTYYMLVRFTKLETAIRSAVALIDKNLPVLTSEEWKLANQLVKVLKPFESVTNTISAEKYCIAALVIPLVNGLEGVIKKMSANFQMFLSPVVEVLLNLANGLKKRCGNYESSHSLLMSTFLDPRFKHLAFSQTSVAENAKKLVINALGEIVGREFESNTRQCENGTSKNQEEHEEDKDEEFGVWSVYEKTVSKTKPKGTPLSRAILEVQPYVDEDIPNRKSQALEWWNVNSALFSNLSKLAKEKLCLLGTSVPCERIFSKAGLLITERRNRLSENKTKKLLFLNSNTK